VVPPLKLRKSLARSVLDYESMRDSDSPPPGAPQMNDGGDGNRAFFCLNKCVRKFRS
jgi:hypothetical protein